MVGRQLIPLVQRVKCRRALQCGALFFSLGAGIAYAHEDRILTLRADGSITEIPASFGRARLTVKGLGTRTPLVQLRIGTRQTTLPICAASIIRTRDPEDIRVTASWYHDQARLPYYINIEFYDPDRKPERFVNPSSQFLFNLHDAKLIKVHRLEANWFDDGGSFKEVEFSAKCKAAMTGIWSTWTKGP